ncbi:MAG TPA: protein kinase [Pyrinomonadaceae bacterium]|nr:protein kinase [Pyrinomonadaceae bacterium]
MPGTMLAERYRIVGLLGKGGMGEVYRADDLKLGQPVALKFLPDHLLRDGAALARFHREVRVARQVSHKNVCRVYDIGEADGRHFLSMEFIKGEELSSLLHRIGRLPGDKAIQIARQICAGLAAAHDNSVLHRDLKPSNVMIDEHGNARITDFGLAGLAEDFRDDETHAGTPAYMAPEQLGGQTFTVRSDIYSLGLVLYELFTGRKAFEATSLNELIKLRRSDATPTTPTSIVKDLDPVIERVIDRCLQKDPALRPSSALQVAAALPGGDPLAAALAAGETPSPEMVAAAPKEGVLRPAVALACVASILAGFVLIIWLSGKVDLHRRVPFEKSPEALKERASAIVNRLGYVDPPVDRAYGFETNGDYFNYVLDHDPSPTRWDQLSTGQPAALYFWYRQSPRSLIPTNRAVARATINDPPPIVSGMINVSLDTLGRLIRFEAIPPQIEVGSSPTVREGSATDTETGRRGDGETTQVQSQKSASSTQTSSERGSSPTVREGSQAEVPSPTSSVQSPGSSPTVREGSAIPTNWAPLFEEAGLDLASFTQTQSKWLPLANSDARAAWEGKLPSQTQIPIRVEAASYHGKPVYFEIVGAWTRPERMQEIQLRTGTKVFRVVPLVLILSFMIVGVLLARKNLRDGRGDRKGALRLAIYIFSALMISWIFLAHHYPGFEEWFLFLPHVMFALFNATLVWLFYIALEPYVRRWWPHRIVAWSRLLAGDFRDPLVGRDILIGSVFGVAIAVLSYLYYLAPGGPGIALTTPPTLRTLLGLRESVGAFFDGPASFAIFIGLSYLFLLLLLYILFRRKEWLSSLAAWLLPTIGLAVSTRTGTHLIGALLAGLIFGLILVVTTRFGLLAMIASMFFVQLFTFYPMTSDFSVWYAGSTIFGLCAGLAVVLYSFYISLGGQPIFKGGLLRE